MAVTSHVFPQWAQGAAAKLQNLGTDTLKVALSNAAGPVTLASAGVQAAKLFTDWTANVAAEITGTGYTAGGATLTGVSISTVGNNFVLACASPSWPSAAFAFNQAIFYDSSALTEQLICFWDLGGTFTVTTPPLVLNISPSGLVIGTPA